MKRKTNIGDDDEDYKRPSRRARSDDGRDQKKQARAKRPFEVIFDDSNIRTIPPDLLNLIEGYDNPCERVPAEHCYQYDTKMLPDPLDRDRTKTIDCSDYCYKRAFDYLLTLLPSAVVIKKDPNNRLPSDITLSNLTVLKAYMDGLTSFEIVQQILNNAATEIDIIYNITDPLEAKIFSHYFEPNKTVEIPRVNAVLTSSAVPWLARPKAVFVTSFVKPGYNGFQINFRKDESNSYDHFDFAFY